MTPWIEALQALADIPVSDTVEQIVTILRSQILLCPVAAEPGSVGGVLQLLTAKDINGDVWMYIYASELSVHNAGLVDQPVISKTFDSYFAMAEANGFGGIAVYGDDGKMLTVLPADYFDRVRHALGL